jgi:hypothetical protein
VIAAALLVALAVAPDAAAPPAPAGWRAVAEGVDHLRLPELDAELVRFDLARFRVEVVVPGVARPLTATALRREEGAVLAVNGGFFDTDGRPLGLRISRGRRVVPLRKVVDWGVLLLRDGGADLVHSTAYPKTGPDPAPNALQVGPRILIGGRPPRLKPQAARRTAVALDPGGRSLTFVVARRRIEAVALADALARLGFDRALMLDGGPSTQLSAEIGELRLEVGGGYPVPDGLVVRPR